MRGEHMWHADTGAHMRIHRLMGKRKTFLKAEGKGEKTQDRVEHHPRHTCAHASSMGSITHINTRTHLPHAVVVLSFFLSAKNCLYA